MADPMERIEEINAAWIQGCLGAAKPSEERLRYHAFEAGVFAGLQGVTWRDKACPYSQSRYRVWWCHGCIVGGEYRLRDKANEAALTALEASHDALRFAIADNCCLLLGSHERMQEFKANPEAAWDAAIADRDALAAKLAAAMQFVDPPSEWPDYEDAPESVRRRIEAAAMLHGVNPGTQVT